MSEYIRIIFLIVLLPVLLSAQNLKNEFDEGQLIKKSRARLQSSGSSSVFSAHGTASVTGVPDTVIKDIISEINPDSIKMFIKRLQDFGERYCTSPNADKAANWLKEKYSAMGYSQVRVDSFSLSEPSLYSKNITAVLPGKKANEYVIIGGHYDSVGKNNMAPGADDNASGSAAALEIARILKKKNYLPECTILFVNFGAEEIGLWGSLEYADKCQNNGMNIKLMINADMISYTARSLDSSKVNINYYTGAEVWLGNAGTAVQKFTRLIPVSGDRDAGYSDSYAFFSWGIQAVYFEENDFSRWYHSPADTVGNYNMNYCAEVIKAACALLLQASTVPPPVPKLTLYNVGDGQSFKAVWSSVNSTDFSMYRVYLGSSAKSIDTSFATSDTSLIIKLNNVSTVYLAVSAITKQGLESSLTGKYVDISAVPPVPYLSLRDVDRTKYSFNMTIYDRALMFSGFNIYRSDSSGGVFTKLNSAPVTETVFSDNSMLPGKYYYFKVTTVYSNNAESPFSEIIRGRIVSMDRGIGLVITADQALGTAMTPSAAQIAEFYRGVLRDFKFAKEELFSGSNYVSLSELGAYSTVIWCNNSQMSYKSFSSSESWIRKYLEMGGRMLLATFQPVEGFSRSYPVQDTIALKSGDFLYDYFKAGAKKSNSNISLLFSGAESKISGYPDLQVDSARIEYSFITQLQRVEAIYPNSAGKTVYAYNSSSGSNPLKGLPVGVEYMGTGYKTILLSFPLYYMRSSQVKEFLHYVLINKFQENATGIVDHKEAAPADFTLEQNYPNPFNPFTSINYSLPVESRVKIEIFNSLGQITKVLADKVLKAGTYREIFDGGSFSSGVYFCRFKAEAFTGGRTYSVTRKMLLLK